MAAEARAAARGAVRRQPRPARPDRDRHRRAARRLALARLRSVGAAARDDAALRRPDLRRGGRRRPRHHRQGRAARAGRPRRLRAGRPRLRALPDGPRGAPRGRQPRASRAPPRGDADRDQVPAHRRALLRGDRPPGRGDRGQGLGRAGAAGRPRGRDRRPRRHRPHPGGERARGARGDRHLHRASGRQPGRSQAPRRRDRRARRAPARGARDEARADRVGRRRCRDAGPPAATAHAVADRGHERGERGDRRGR